MKKSILFRASFAVVVIAIFAGSIYPLKPRPYFETFEKHMVKEDEDIRKVLALAKAEYAKPGNARTAPAVLEKTASDLNVDLTEYIRGMNLITNRDAVSFIREHCASRIRLGLDLNGGAEFLVELQEIKDDREDEKDQKEVEALQDEAEEEKESEPKRSLDRDRDAAVEIIRNRLEKERIFESEISPAGKNLISIKVPTVSKSEKQKLLDLIKRSARLEFRLVHKDNKSLVSEYKANPENFVEPPGYERLEMMEFEKGKKPVKRIFFVKYIPEMTGTGIRDALPDMDSFGQRMIRLVFDSRSAREFGRVTRENIGRNLAIVLDGELYSAPTIRDAIEGGHAQITGNFSQDEANEISTALISGSLPVKMRVVGVFDTDPTLGRQQVKIGVYAGMIGLAIVVLFMVSYYLIPGAVASVALMCNIVLVLGALAAFEATLTLPGIAGIILTMGMAVDANVLIFERIREELEKNKTLQNAIGTGYKRAFVTILDANLTTLFTALILMWKGTGPIKGFAVTLSIGILTSMFTALFLTRLMFDIINTYLQPRKMKMMKFFSEPKFSFLKLRYGTSTISCLLVAGSLIFAGMKGGQIFGIDFTGGTQATFTYENAVPQQKIIGELDKAGYDVKAAYKKNLMKDSRQLELIIRDRSIAGDEGEKQDTSPISDIEPILREKFPDAGFSAVEERSMGGLIGWEFSKSAITAIVLAVCGILLYISLRFEFAFATASIIAVVHDIIIATGVFLLLGGELSLPVIAALLTIIGYSLNDTIVVFDRIREDLSLLKNRSYRDIIDLSINQTLSRTILTSATTMLVLLVLYFSGSVAIRDFVLVMIIGVFVGTYSSIFVASPIVAVWHKRIGIKKN